jgi:hypothetical protein
MTSAEPETDDNLFKSSFTFIFVVPVLANAFHFEIITMVGIPVFYGHRFGFSDEPISGTSEPA